MNSLSKLQSTTAALMTAIWCLPAAAQPYVIESVRPASVGDEFRVSGSLTNTKQRRVTATGQSQPDLDITTSLKYAYYTEVKEVKDGAPTRQRCTITSLILDDGTQKRSLLGAPPEVVVYLDERGFTKIDVVTGTASDEALAAMYDVFRLEPREVRPEDLMATSQPRNVGETWAVNPKRAVDLLATERLDVKTDRLRATATLVSAETVADATTLTVELKLATDHVDLQGALPDIMRLTEASLEITYSIELPVETAKPIMGMTTDRLVNYVGVGGQGAISIKADHTARMVSSWERTIVGD